MNIIVTILAVQHLGNVITNKFKLINLLTKIL